METVNEILSKLENADNTTKNQLENELVISELQLYLSLLINYKL